MSILSRFFRNALNPQLGRSLKPIADTYRNFGRMLVDVFGSLKLIDRTHPWMRPGTKVRPLEVLSFVWAKTDWTKPWQPVPVFVASISMMLLFGSLSFTGIALSGAASAGSAYAGMFTSPSPGTDLALSYMRDAFGVQIPGVPAGVVDGVVQGFQEMMGLYSMAMLIIAGFILLYIVMTAIASTAHEGRFGGNSFNQIWAPIRLVVAIGLLVPLPMAGSGITAYNSGQYIVMKLSEWGSGLATNLWIPFATSLVAKQDVMAMPNIEAAASVVRGVFINEFCMARHNFVKNHAGIGDDEAPPVVPVDIVQGIIHQIHFTPKGDTTRNYCGITSYEIVTDSTPFINELYMRYNVAHTGMILDVRRVARRVNEIIGVSGALGSGTEIEDQIFAELIGDPAGTDSLINIISGYQQDLAQAVSATQASQASAAKTILIGELSNAGWAGASMWFNTIARLNAEFMAAVRALPSSKAPDLKTAVGSNTSMESSLSKEVGEGLRVINQYLDGMPARLPDFGYDPAYGIVAVGDVTTASVIAGLEQSARHRDEKDWLDYLGSIGEAGSQTIGEILSSTFANSTIGGPFGHMGVGVDTQLDRVNPLADLAAIGDWMITRSFTLLGFSYVTPGTLLMYLGMAGATMGLVLFYVLPLLPFIRFMFALVGWLLNILEALIAIPLVAIAHLTARGEGLSGDLARSAYFTIFSVFLRPALLIVGMIVAVMMFSVAIGVLNDMYKGAVTGFRGDGTASANGGLSVIMYTILYTVIAYMLCNLCFHLIEEIPNRAMTWINQAASKDISQDEGVVKAMHSAGDNLVFAPMRTGGKLISAKK